MSSNPFLENLKISGLLSDEKVMEVSGRYSNSAMDVVAADLVAQGILTKFQVEQLQAGQHKGLVLGQYHLLEEIGRGGYGCVYKARHKLMNRIIALKVIAPERVEDSRARAWFRREVLAATQLTHPNICIAHDADEIDGVLFFAMEFIDGLNLETLIRAHGPVPIATACEMLLQTAKALQYANEMGMVHRDIKPANLLIPRGALDDSTAQFAAAGIGAPRPVLVKVVDFGLARLQTTSATNTLVLQHEKSFIGTPAYVSPEQARNIHEVDIRSDLYSLGCTFYHALAGRPPFLGGSALHIVVQHMEREPDAIETHRPEIPAALASIIRRLMAKKPEKRFQTPMELINELGFFYASDRSGVRRMAPYGALGGGPGPNAPPQYASPPPPAPPVYAAVNAFNSPSPIESEYMTTRVNPRDNAQAVAVREGNVVVSERSEELCGAMESVAPSIELSPRVEAEAIVAGAPVANPPVPQKEAKPVQAIAPTLVKHWQQWQNVVADFVSGQPPSLSHASYRFLHRELLTACEAQIPCVGATQAALLRRMVDLVQPWLTLETLDAIDKETIASLHQQCHALNQSLGIGSAWIVRTILLVLLVIAVIVGIAFLVPAVPVASWWSAVRRYPLVSVGVAAAVALVGGVYVMSRLLRTLRS